MLGEDRQACQVRQRSCHIPLAGRYHPARIGVDHAQVHGDLDLIPRRNLRRARHHHTVVRAATDAVAPRQDGMWPERVELGAERIQSRFVSLQAGPGRVREVPDRIVKP